MKTTQDKNMTDRIGVVYVQNKTELLFLIEPGAFYDENQTTQRRNQSICLVYTEIKNELFGPIWLGVVCDEN